MTKAAFEKIKAGLSEASIYLDGSGDKSGYRIRVPARVNVKKVGGSCLKSSKKNRKL